VGHVEGLDVGCPEGGADLVTIMNTEGETAEAEPLASVKSEAVPDETSAELCKFEASVEAKDDDDKVDVTDDKTLVCVL